MIDERAPIKTGILEVRRLNEADFAGLADAWNDLLERSEADPLFMSWAWLYSWWEVWSDSLELELALFGVFEKGEKLIGLAPFFLHRSCSLPGVTVRRLQFMGNAWHIRHTVRTEYCGLIIQKGQEEMVTEIVFLELIRLHWHEMVVCDQSLQGVLHWQKAFDRVGQNIVTIPRMVDTGIRVAVDRDFSTWLDKLGRNTRLKTYNRRRYLQEKGDLSLIRVSPQDVGEFLSTLNTFHRARWGKPCFDESAIAFHKKLLTRLSENQIALSELDFNGETVSVLYDVKAGSTRYNLQAGFEENMDPKVSLGTLHLGYAIEESFHNSTIKHYDLLAGCGKKSFYKSRFQGEKVHFLTVQFVRHRAIRWIYRIQSWLPERLRQQINRYVRL